MSLILNTFRWISDSPGSLPPLALGFHHWALARARGQTSHHRVSPSDRLPGLTFQAPLPESPHTHNANVLAAPSGHSAVMPLRPKPASRSTCAVSPLTLWGAEGGDQPPISQLQEQTSKAVGLASWHPLSPAPRVNASSPDPHRGGSGEAVRPPPQLSPWGPE